MNPRIALMLVLAAAACGTRDAEVSLAVDGRTNSTPSIAAAGRIVAVAWGAAADGKTDVYVSVSRDGGHTFGTPTPIDSTGTARLSGEMPPRIAVRNLASGGFELSALWIRRAGSDTSVMFSRSTDGGRTFATPVALQSPAAQGARGWPALTVDGNGVAHAVWLDHRGMAGGPAHAHGQPSTEDGAARAQKSSIYYASVSGDQQKPETEIAKGVCYCCKTAIAATGRGDLYSVWRHVYPGNLRDMAFSAAPAGGAFSAPVRVSEDHWQIDGCPDDGPAMAVDAAGAAHVVWPTVVTGAQPRGSLFYATSADGRTFSERIAVPTLGSIKPSHPQIAVDAKGTLLIGWDEQAGDRRVVAVRTAVRRAHGSLAFGDVIRLAEGAAYYPVLAVTDAGFVAAWATPGERSAIGVKVVRE